ncbi:hypothetical protein [Spiroplasma endosymbiont of Nephrotoma flavescens]|uniref:hypothetical protein n=1 Tax=Spiroplasma endosymbiont of Nephrotoma flavescens TaxID=3066302 RepID=UPI00313B8952
MKSFAILFTCTYKYNSANKLNVLHYINENINSEIEIRKEIYKKSLWNKYNNKNDDSWINYKGNAITNKYNRFK